MKQWSQPIRVENPEHGSLITTRTIHSALWFVNNQALENHILGYLAKYQEKHEVELYNASLQGNHVHLDARFPNYNRAAFMRDMNARIAEGVRKYVKQFKGGPLFERRYTSNILPLDVDVEKKFFYCALQVVQDGLAERISDYLAYNATYDAIKGRERKYKLVAWGEYHSRKRFDPTLTPKDFTTTHTLRFTKLPGYEHLPQEEYEKVLLARLEELRVKEVNKKKAEGHTFPSKESLRKVVPGSLPKNTKKGGMRPIVICCCPETRRKVLAWYFAVVEAYLEASREYRAGNRDVEFPKGTYPPPLGVQL